MTRGLWWESMRWNQFVGPLSVSPASHFVQLCEGFGAGRNHTKRCGWWIALTSSIPEGSGGRRNRQSRFHMVEGHHLNSAPAAEFFN